MGGWVRAYIDASHVVSWNVNAPQLLQAWQALSIMHEVHKYACVRVPGPAVPPAHLKKLRPNLFQCSMATSPTPKSLPPTGVSCGSGAGGRKGCSM